MAQRHQWTAKKAQQFLVELSETGHVGDAAQHAGVPRSTAYKVKKNDPVFAAAWDAAMAEAMETTLEAEAVRRATQGVEEPVYHKGHVVGHVQKYSDTLLIFLLKGGMPEKYKERSTQEVTGKGGGAIIFENVAAMTREQRQARLAVLRAKQEQSADADGD